MSAFSLMNFDKYQVLNYQKELHESQLLKWYEQWGWDPKGLLMLPPNGLIVENIAALFIYYTNCSTCFLDGFISNKEAAKEDRDEALNTLFAYTIEEVKRHGVKYMVGSTKQVPVENRVEKFGFQLLKPCTVFIRSV